MDPVASPQLRLALAQEALRRSTVLWLTLPGTTSPRLAWYAWVDGAAYLVHEGDEQQLPGLGDLPTVEMLTDEEPPLSPDSLGMFVGRHIFTSSSEVGPSDPGVIFLFRLNLLRDCTDREELENEVRITVQHEVGHLLGLDEDELDEWGLA